MFVVSSFCRASRERSFSLSDVASLFAVKQIAQNKINHECKKKCSIKFGKIIKIYSFISLVYTINILK